ncbi:DNA ligase D [Allosphingosinicella vermicomposti]|uniref:DNA ligase D n=1 Tax=Allosphingosinicella vermicomposti TaxID=614671 RepID=UPI000D101D74|nr:DNA ligase D [Allosphingosinicella vermicomposti]
MVKKAQPDPLARYNAKRDFTKTREPAGKVEATGRNIFMVQKHDATRLHYDFRLELDGTLKSWAVTRGPSLDPADKRLAVRTEDHPMSYATFEGTIPKGQYGGGTVMLWDRGTWLPEPGKDPRKTLEQGHLHFSLDGERMKGEWILIRLKPRPGERNENWLLRKIEDKHAGSSAGLTEKYLTSVATGRTMNEIAEGDDPPWNSDRADQASSPSPRRKPGSQDKKARSSSRDAGLRRNDGKKVKVPQFRDVQKATLVNHVPSGSAWLHEMKFDGYRCLLAIASGRAKIYTRTGLDWTDKFPEIAAAAAELEVGSALIDGEIVRVDDKGRTNFSALQQAISEGGKGLTLFAFDILEVDGEDLTKLPNIDRKQRLAALLGEGKPPFILYADHVIGAGEKLYDAMCDAGQEGIISKKADAPYRGSRTKAWLKIKCTRRQEFVIVGWTPSESKARALRALLLAVNEDGGLRYVGKVGTGFSMAALEMLLGKLKKLEVKKAPVDAPRSETRGAHWVKPELVAEVAFAEFTGEGSVRHTSFLGLRDDKPAEAVVEEKPQAVPEAAMEDVEISNPDRVIFPDAKVTKGQLADYYRKVAPLMLEWSANRPISLVRCPQGRAKKCFFQKHDAGTFGAHVHHVPVLEKRGNTEDYLYVTDQAGLLTCVQMGTIEFHGWGSRVADIEKADRLIFDLDPDEGLGFDAVKKAAVDLKRHLADMGLRTFPLLTGGKGLHIVVPLTPKAEWPEVKDFAQRFALALSEAEPDRFTANLAKVKRKGRIFLDYLRNQRGATAIMPYSARARETAPVSAPINWNELDEMDSGGRFTVKDVDLLLKRASGRALQGWGEAEQVLPDL